MPTTTDVLTLGAGDLIEAYRERRLSPVEVADAALARIERDHPVLDAFCLVDADAARAEARRSEERWRRGTPAGALDGVPVGVKDVFLTRGWPTLRGSRAIDPAGPWEDDAPAVAALRRHGAVLAGKTTTPEFGWKGVTDSPLEGVTRNPWDPSRTAGGSSGGSSAALAAGMVPLALGTDGGGSIRIPASFCGLPGIKPTYGRVPAWPASPFGTVAHAGPMARTVADLALMLDVLAEPDARDWTALPPPERSFLDGLEDGVRGLRVAFSPDLGHVTVDPEVAAAVARGAEALAALGADVERADPGFADPRDIYETLWSAGAAKLAGDMGGPPADVFDPGFARLVDAGRSHSLRDYLVAVARRDELGIRMSRFHRDWDLLVMPTLPIGAFAAGHEVPEGWPQQGWPSWTPFTYPFNLTQQPAATVPCGFTADGLPIGLQIVGPRYQDALVLRAARAFETAHPQPTLAPSPPAVR
jgi:aspartyl-tRNA(Asn)/glutamyl-tRNA(Gln) amidotransferase subunit A